MLDAPWPSGFGPPDQRPSPPVRTRPTAVDMGAAEAVEVEADIDVLPGGTMRLGEKR